MTNFVFPIDDLIEKSAQRTAEILIAKIGVANLQKEKSCEEEELITRTEARKFLKMSSTTFWRLQKDGIIKGYGIGGKNYYKRSELEESLIEKK